MYIYFTHRATTPMSITVTRGLIDASKGILSNQLGEIEARKQSIV
jgi:hypothetical protein